MAKFEGITRDPYQGFRFRVSFDGIAVAAFQSVSGLREETEIAEYREGNDASRMRKLPGITSYDNITLERGITSDDRLSIWRREIMNIGLQSGLNVDGLGQSTRGASEASTGRGSAFRKNVYIQLFDKGGVGPVVTWRLLDAWPSALEIGDLDAGSSDVLIETLEIVHEGLVTTRGNAGVFSKSPSRNELQTP